MVGMDPGLRRDDKQEGSELATLLFGGLGYDGYLDARAFRSGNDPAADPLGPWHLGCGGGEWRGRRLGARDLEHLSRLRLLYPSQRHWLAHRNAAWCRIRHAQQYSGKAIPIL